MTREHPTRRPAADRRPAQRGFTLIEVLGALAILALITIGAAAMINSSLEDMRGQHVGQHQAKVVEASERYVREHYAALVTATATAPVAVPMATLSALLPVGFQPTNAFGQEPCLRVMLAAPGRLNVLIVAEGGVAIPTKDLAYVAAQAGPGGGLVSPDEPTIAKGAFGSWRVDTALYGGAPCGAASGGPISNRLASALFFDGPATGTDFLYRGDVPGHPELNSLSVPMGMTGAAVRVEDDATDPLCNVADPLAQGRIAVSTTGALLSCQAGVWRRQGSASWKDPVADYASLPLVGNQDGDTRITLDISRAFVWTGAAWTAISVDQLGNLDVPNQVNLVNPVVANGPCAPVGALSREASGRTLSCQGGLWRTQASTEIDPSQSENGSVVVMRSAYMAYPGGTNFYDAGTFTYDAPNDTVQARIDRPITPDKDGLIISNATLDMSIGTYDNRTDVVTVTLIAQVIDNDSGLVLAANQARQTRMSFDRTFLAVTLSKAVPRNVNGYTYQMLVRWTRFVNNYPGNFYDRANYLDTAGNVVELTPIYLTWNFDMTY